MKSQLPSRSRFFLGEVAGQPTVTRPLTRLGVQNAGTFQLARPREELLRKVGRPPELTHSFLSPAYTSKKYAGCRTHNPGLSANGKLTSGLLVIHEQYGKVGLAS